MKESVSVSCCGVHYSATLNGDVRWVTCHRCYKALRWPDQPPLDDVDALELERRERRYRGLKVEVEQKEFALCL